MLPTTSTRVQENTREEVNERIRQKTINRLNEIGTNQEKIDLRLKEIEEEWDIERAIEANASSIALVGLALGATVNRKWFLLPTLVAGFLLQHSLQGWCPPVPVLRRLGFRTQREIDNERTILLSRKGKIQAGADSEKALSSIEIH